jgi:hypothetical protein
MDTLPPSFGDLNDLERRLSALQPSTAGLDADSMLFAAGRNSVRPGMGRLVWPVLSGCLAVAALVLGVGLLQERQVRQELAAQLQRQTPGPVAPADVPDIVAANETPAPTSYLAAARALAQSQDWPTLVMGEPVKGPASPSRSIWWAGQRDRVLDP